MDSVRLGVIGTAGSMAGAHQKYFKDIPNLVFAAAADHNADGLDKIVDEYKIKPFPDASAMIASGEIDAVLPAERLTVTLSYDDAGIVSDDDAEPAVDEAAVDDLRCIELSWSGPSWERRADALRSLSESSC